MTIHRLKMLEICTSAGETRGRAGQDARGVCWNDAGAAKRLEHGPHDFKRRRGTSMKRWMHLATISVLAACASAAPQPGNSVTIVIENNLIPPGPVTVYLVPRSGIERMLGTAHSSQRSNLVYRGLPPVGEHRLVARTLAGQNIVSTIFNMDGVLGLEWSLASNFVRVTETKD